MAEWGTKPFAISCGDPAGIGPEIIGKSWKQRVAAGLKPFFAIGNFADFNNLAGIPVRKISQPMEAGETFRQALPVLHIHEAAAAASAGSSSASGTGTSSGGAKPGSSADRALGADPDAPPSE